MKKKTLLLLFAVFLVFTVGMHGCGITAALRKIDARMAEAIHSMDKAIASLNQQSANWQTVIADLEKEITADMQSTLSNEVQNLTRNAVLTSGGEIRCNAEFMRVKLRRELIDMRNSLAQSLNRNLVKVGLTTYQFDLLQQEFPEPFICDIVPSAVDLSLDPERRMKLDIYGFDLRTMPIYVSYRSYGLFQAKPSVGFKEYKTEMAARALAPRTILADRPTIRENIRMNNFTLVEPWKLLNQNISSSLTVLSDFHAVLDLTASGANLPPNANVVTLSWNNKLQSEIPILTHIQTLDCNTTSKPLSATLAQTYIPPAVPGPDKDFFGHGPCMIFNLTLSLDAARRNLKATFSLNAYECNSDRTRRRDYTQAFGTKTITLFTAQEDETITSFNAATSMYDTHFDTNHDPYISYYGGTSPVEKIEWIGDTKGDEAGSKTGVIITFRQFEVNVERCVFK